MSHALNPKQQQAVLAKPGPLLILAGAGSGKTRVLTERIIHLIQDHDVSPWNIFAVTFTNKAAGEMKERVAKKLWPVTQGLWISTFHSSCLRILRKHGEVLGYESQFAIYDTSDQLVLIKKILKSMDLSDKVYPPKAVLKQIDRAKNEGQTPEDFPTEGDHYLSKVQEVYGIYQRELKTNQAMDFGDLILNVILLFQKSPETLVHYQNQFQHILVDEYQDTNKVQYQLIQMLAGKYQNLFVVGDDDQSIYRFRGAEIANILSFQEDYPDAAVIRLEQNYRSTQNILGAANAVIRNNSARMGKELWTDNGMGSLVKIFHATEEKQEAEFIASQIQKLRQNVSLNDVALFYRTNAQSRALEDALRKERLPYKIFGGMKFYDRAEIKDLMAYLRVIVNPYDSVSLKRIINVPARKLGKTTLDKIDEAATRNFVGFWQVLENPGHKRWGMKINAPTVKRLHEFYRLIQSLQDARADMPANEFVSYVLDETGYWQMLKDERTIEAEGRQENLSEFITVYEEFFEENSEARLEDFLDQISLASDVDQLEEGADFITLMTIHLAKGLEFPYVFIAGLEEGLFPHVRSLDAEADLEEERRICYVAMTRAMKELTLSYADSRRVFGTAQYNIPSRFLGEIPEDHLEEVSQPSRFAGYQPPSKPKSSLDYDTYVDLSDSQLDSPFRLGSRVSHDVFGEGRIERCQGQGDNLKVTVQFQNGAVKTLSLKYAHLTLLSG